MTSLIVIKIFKNILNYFLMLSFVKMCIAVAMDRDASSGGGIRLAIITKDGVERQVTHGDKLPQFYQGWLSNSSSFFPRIVHVF